MKTILVSGGAGYIGSHVVIELLSSGYDVVIADNFSNSKSDVIGRIEKIANKQITHVDVDLCDKQKLSEVFQKYTFDGVVHFAGLKSVGESVAHPLSYYRNNIDSTLSLCEIMVERGVKNLIFSSSATVYGDPSELPLKETSRVGIGITNPYGQTKFMIEQMLSDLKKADDSMNIISLRYFNPVGAHKSGLIGEDPNGVPNNLLPYISQVAAGTLEKLKVFGNDYYTPDGSGVRDYIHVVDLARGHIAALQALGKAGIAPVYNLGSGTGTSVLELIKAFEKASGKQVPYESVARRPGDIGSCYADPSLALKDLGWKTEKTISEACRDAWRWQQYSTAHSTQ